MKLQNRVFSRILDKVIYYDKNVCNPKNSKFIVLMINIRYKTMNYLKLGLKCLFQIHTLLIFCKFNNPTFRFIGKRMMFHLKTSEICNLIVPNMCGVANQNTNITTCHFIPFYFFDDCF